MLVRAFQEKDIEQIVALFYETVHTVNKQDYSQDQLDAWASRDEEKERRENWKEALSRNISYVAEMDGRIVGFSDMHPSGYLDRLFVHKDYQGQGIATALVSALESEARRLHLARMETDSSITAKPFFEGKGYAVVKSQIVERRGVQLMNYKMKKML